MAALNPFRKKISSQIARSALPIEPYEVAPGIWNTDATAKVFGYLEPEKQAKSRSKSAGSGSRIHRQIHKRKPVAEREMHNLSGQSCEDAKADTLNRRTPKAYTEDSDRFHQEQSSITRTADMRDERKMKTVSKDDQLVQRGANPRTGLVSPFIVSNSSEDSLAQDCVNLGRVQKDNRLLPVGRTRSGKWKQQGGGWSFVGGPLLSPIAQSINDPLSHKVSMNQLEDELLIDMPGGDHPDPENLSDQQIRNYREGVAQAYKLGGSAAMVHPSTLPSPRQSTPDGPSTPPKRLQRIRRKVIESATGRREESSDTVVIGKEKRIPSKPTRGEDVKEQSKVSFLDQIERKHLGQTKGHTQSPSPFLMPQQKINYEFLKERIGFPSINSIDPPAAPTLSQYLPRSSLHHPNRFANLETSSYHHPALLLPKRLQPLTRKRQTMEDACTTITTFTLHRKQEKEQKHHVRRRDGNTVVPKTIASPCKRYEILKEIYPLPGTPTKKSSYVIKHMADTSDSKKMKANAVQRTGQTAPSQERTEERHKLRVPLQHLWHSNRGAGQEAEQRVRKVTIENYRSQQLHQIQPPR